MDALDAQRTMETLIQEAFQKGRGCEKFGRSLKKRQEEAQKFADWFERYFGLESADGNDPDETRNTGSHAGNQAARSTLSLTLGEAAKDPASFAENIRLGIKALMKDKYFYAVKAEFFIQYLNSKYRTEIGTAFLDYLKWRNREDRLLKLLKYMHSGSKTREDIAQTFGITKRVLDEDLAILQDGFEFMGTEMEISNLVREKNTYSSPIHPLFLSMDSAEIYALTVGLKLLSKGTIFEHALDRVSDQVYIQLSGFAHDMVKKHSDEEKIAYGEEKPRFMNSMEMGQFYSSPYCLFLKEEKPCIVSYRKLGSICTVTGTLRLAPDDPDRFRKITVQTDCGDFTIDIEDIQSLMGIT